MILNTYTDGSNDRDVLAAWAFIVFDDKNNLIHKDSGVLTGEICKMRNVGGEIFGVRKAIEWAKSLNYKINIYHDYSGLRLWIADLFGEKPWRCNNQWTKEYREFMFNNKQFISNMFLVKGHSSINGNEQADKLAGEALKKYKNNEQPHLQTILTLKI